MSENIKVRDFNGKLIPKNKARKIDDHYYEEGVTCIRMSDGKWYRTNTNKIVFDWETGVWLFRKNDSDTGLMQGLVDDGSLGYFTPTGKNVSISYKKDQFVRQFKVDLFNTQNSESLGSVKASWVKGIARTAEIAEKFGYQESFNDGRFYRKDDCSGEEKIRLTQPGLPANEKSNTYSMEDDQPGKRALQDNFENNNFKIEAPVARLARLIPNSFGLEFESSIGFVPARIREHLGFRNLRDGSISGVEYVTIPLKGAKGLQAIKLITSELSKRCSMNTSCSVHVHFGNVARDKASILALWNLCYRLQNELLGTFPFSRTNSIRNDGKVYCKPLPDLGLDLKTMFKLGKEDFHKKLNYEFGKIYAFLNNQRTLGEEYARRIERETKVSVLGGKPTRLWRNTEKRFIYSTKNKEHSIRGNKWDRPQRYYWMNLLPTFFSPAETIEWRPHEATFSYEKTLMWMLVCTAIMEYAKNNIRHCFTLTKITLEEVLNAYLPKEMAAHITGYMEHRKSTFKNANGSFKAGWEKIEIAWMDGDKDYKFNNRSIESFI